MSEAGAVQQTVEGMDNPQPVKQETVLFGFDRSTLTPKAKSDLDSLQQTISGLKYYTVDVTGYTDSTGPASYNLELSRRRADAVVRYLTENDKMPLAKIHILGYGEDTPAASNHSRSGRKQNRRVDVTILAPANEAQASTASPSAEVTPAPNSAGPQQP